MNTKKQKQGGILGKLRVKAVRAKISEDKWNFDESRVKDWELVACCYWEYARESSFIRSVVQRLKDVDQGKVAKPLVTAGKTYRVLLEAAQAELEPFNRDLTRLYSIGTPVEKLFRRLPFPKPWQSLTSAQREAGRDFKVEIPAPVKFPAFQVSSNYYTAAELYRIAREDFDAQQAKWARLAELSEQGVDGLKESAELRAQLMEQEKHPTPLLVRGIGGLDSFIGQVNWREFTDKQIVTCFDQWVTDNRPTTLDTKQLVGRRNDKGRKLNDWRVMLDRLSIMRLLHHFTLNKMCPEALNRYRSTDWYRERQNANRNFHRLFPFLPDNESPLSWPTKGGTK